MKEQYKKESPVLSLLGMGGGGTGTALGGLTVPKTYVDDVFSTFLYDGNGGTQSINNGIDLAGEGGLVWFKKRNNSTYGGFWDTERGVTKRLRPDTTDSEATASNLVTSFNSNGVSISATGGTQINNNNDDYASWTFRKAPGFFDVVTYTGNGVSGLRAINHNLGSTPAFIIVKYLDGGSQWYCWHKDLTSKNYYILLNDTGAQGNAGTQVWEATDTTFSIHSGVAGNGVGENYVAYLFADDDAQFGTGGNESIVKCGTYTGDGTNNDTKKITLGFEPQWVLIKRTSTSSSWFIHDNMRGIASGGYDPYLLANSANAETTDKNVISLHPDGFSVLAGEGHNSNGATYIYMAIRRPNKPPEAAINVFAIDTGSGSSLPTFDSNFPVDMAIGRHTGNGESFTAARLMGLHGLYTTGSAAEHNDAGSLWDSNVGWSQNYGSDYISYMFKRAPGFMDVVAYSGTGSATGINHNLGVVPELMIVKSRSISDHWQVYSSVTDETDFLMLNSTDGTSDQQSKWNDTAPTSSVFTVNTDTGVNQSSATYVAYLFATLPGISKVGSYTGTGNAVNVPCGFTNGARFILIKRTDNTGDWYVWDSVRGITSGNDPYFLLNDTTSEVTNTDYVDPLTSGFTVTASAPAALNASGGTYLFLAIA